ncbi:hypothetical protein Tco_0714334 [Tanacetum coccineum]
MMILENKLESLKLLENKLESMKILENELESLKLQENQPGEFIRTIAETTSPDPQGTRTKFIWHHLHHIIAFGSGSGGCGDDEIADDEDGGEDEEDEEDGSIV